MKSLLDEYQKTKEFLVCIDSDGCAIDTMDIKHIKCFGPCMVKEWHFRRKNDERLKFDCLADAAWNECGDPDGGICAVGCLAA